MLLQYSSYSIELSMTNLILKNFSVLISLWLLNLSNSTTASNTDLSNCNISKIYTILFEQNIWPPFNYTRRAEVTCDDSSASLTLCKKKKRRKLLVMSRVVHTHILNPIVRAGSDDRSHSETVRFVQSKLPRVKNRQ